MKALKKMINGRGEVGKKVGGKRTKHEKIQRSQFKVSSHVQGGVLNQ